MSTYITRFADSGNGVPVAVKDLIDMAGVVTTAGCRALADLGEPAERDAPLLREIRRREAAGEVWIVGLGMVAKVRSCLVLSLLGGERAGARRTRSAANRSKARESRHGAHTSRDTTVNPDPG